MADIELVIKIPEGLKNDFESEQWTALSCMEMKNALEKATPIPKGHGDLIDRNSILCDDLSCDLCGYTDECFKLLAPTILKADTKSGEQRK